MGEGGGYGWRPIAQLFRQFRLETLIPAAYIENDSPCIAERAMSGSTLELGSSLVAQKWFATTHWSVVLGAADASAPGAEAALEELCRTYWFPLYTYVRRQGHNSEDAQDLTQEFFARLLERKCLQLADRERGRFRSFLLTSLKHFLINE